MNNNHNFTRRKNNFNSFDVYNNYSDIYNIVSILKINIKTLKHQSDWYRPVQKHGNHNLNNL